MLDGETAGRPLVDSDPRQVGPYRLLSVLGSGAMGRVYLGQGAEGPAVAVKVVRADLADITLFRKRFARELSVVRKIDGAGIARVVDADPDARQPWIATEHIAGPSLQSHVDEQGTLSDLEIRALARAIAAALTEIHGAGVVHRDLKPSNVLLGPDGPKVIDFGVAHATDASVVLTGTGHIPGTPAYMSPEQAEAKAVGPATDVFALGSLLVFAATGRLAFGEGAPLAVLNRVLNGTPDLDGVAVRDPRLRELITACLTKDPADRPTAARIIEVCDPDATHVAEPELAAAAAVGPVEGFLPAEPVRAAPVGAGEAVEAAAEGLASPVLPEQPGSGGTTATIETAVAGRSAHRKKIVAGGVVAALAIAGILAASLGGGSGSGAEKSGSEQRGGSKVGAAFPTGPASEPGTSASAGSQTSTSPAVQTPAGGGAVPLAGSSSAPAPTTTTGQASGGPAGKPSSAPSSAPAHPTTTTTQPPATQPNTTPPTSAPPSPTNVPPKPMTEGFIVTVPAWFGSATVDVSWRAHPDATSYDIHFTDDFASGTDQIYHSTGTSYSIPGVAAGSKYCITMRAVNQYGTSAWYSPTYCGTI